MTSVCIADALFNGTCRYVNPPWRLKSSVAKCRNAPSPVLPKVSLPGFAFA